MHPLAEKLAEGWKGHFFSADREIKWVAAEQERSLWLSPNTVLVGRVDARGFTGDGLPFFGEWKTASAYKARRMEEEKIKWRTDPQALTYGVLLGGQAEPINRFTVRWALKTPTPEFAFEWFTYTPAEVEHWRGQLIGIADEIREWRKRAPSGPWRTNFSNCYQYGLKHPCPFVGRCSRQEFGKSLEKPRIPHLAIERVGGEHHREDMPSDAVVIDASRVGDYLDCPEMMRGKWEGEGYQEESEALTIGTDFHSLIAQHINSMIAQTSPTIERSEKEKENVN